MARQHVHDIRLYPCAYIQYLLKSKHPTFVLLPPELVPSHLRHIIQPCAPLHKAYCTASQNQALIGRCTCLKYWRLRWEGLNSQTCHRSGGLNQAGWSCRFMSTISFWEVTSLLIHPSGRNCKSTSIWILLLSSAVSLVVATSWSTESLFWVASTPHLEEGSLLPDDDAGNRSATSCSGTPCHQVDVALPDIPSWHHFCSECTC